MFWDSGFLSAVRDLLVREHIYALLVSLGYFLGFVKHSMANTNLDDSKFKNASGKQYYVERHRQPYL